MKLKTEKLTKKIEIAVISDEGHSEFSLVPQEALEKVRQLTNKEGKWLYLDNVYTNTETLTELDLINAVDVTLTNAVAGGGVTDSYNVTTTIVDDIGFAATMNLDTATKNIEIKLNVGNIKALSLHSKNLSNELKFILQGEAAREVNELAKAYGEHEIRVLGTPAMATFEYKDMPVDVSLDLDLNQNKIVFIFNETEKYKILNLREWYFKTLGRKIDDFVSNEMNDIRELVNV